MAHKNAGGTGVRARMGSFAVAGMAVGVPVVVGAGLTAAYLAYAALPPVPVPAQNPMSEAKRVLGKMLFWDEQMSTSNVVSCGTCHVPANGGADNRLARHPGDDNVLNTADDIQGSPGVIKSDTANNFVRDAVFGLAPQLTDRSANSMINAAYAPNLFWDGRATSEFRDPETNAVVIPAGGALESQAVGPILNDVEMAHAGFSWSELREKLARVDPLALSTNVPADVQAARQQFKTYPALFAAAFGDSQITAARIGMAIATYQRTLISNQSPFDSFRAGNVNALTPQQQQGLTQFQQHQCSQCHSLTNDMTTDHSFRNIGLRPVAEDNGRQAITGNVADRGKFKVPNLRNVALKRTFMHNGQFTTLPQVLAWYARAGGAPPQFPDNQDPLMNQVVPLPPGDSQVITAFLQSLTDPRVANSQFPFDRPLLFVDRPTDRSTILGGGVAGSGAITPAILVQAPTMVGNLEYRIGLFNARGGAQARLGLSRTGPVNGRINPERWFSFTTTTGTGNGNGVATQHWTLTTDEVQPGEVLFAQWFVTDAAAAGGQALSGVAQLRFFCGSMGCPCDDIDFNNDGARYDPTDIDAFLSVFSEGPCLPVGADCNDVDFNNDGSQFDPADIDTFLRVFSEGPCRE